jgi:hypothetical protein
MVFLLFENAIDSSLITALLISTKYLYFHQIECWENLGDLIKDSQGLLWLPKSRSQKNRQVPFSGASFESQEPV